MKRVRIETVASEDGGYPLSRDTIVFDPSGNKIHGITAIDVRFRIDEPVRAEISLLSADLRTEALAAFMITDPTDGKHKQVRKIEFADGSVIDL